MWISKRCSTVVIFLIINLFKSSTSLSWDQATISRLFPDNFYQQLPADKLKTPCIQTFSTFLDQLFKNQVWAQSIIDSWGSTPSGVFSQYTTISYGHFDQCINNVFYDQLLQTHSAQYVLVEVSLGGKKFTWAVCLPLQCDNTDIDPLMTVISSNLGLTYTKTIARRIKSNDGEWSGYELAVFYFIMSIVGVAVISSVYDLCSKGPKRPVFVAFSLVTNFRELLQTRSSGSFEFLDGIKAFSCFQIILFHVLCCGYAGAYNEPDRWHIFGDPVYFFSHASCYAVDTFFLISGLLLAYQFLAARQSGSKFNLLQFYLRRLFRLYPALFMMDLVLNAYILRLNGPNPGLAHGMWHDLNYWLSYSEYRPLYHLWYIVAEIKLFLISPLILFPLWYFGYKMFPVVIGIIFTIATYYKLSLDWNTAFDFQHLPEFRCAPWLIGLLLGFIIVEEKERKIKTASKYPGTSTFFCVLGLLLVMYMKRQPFETNLYTAFYNVLWSLLCSWPIYLLFNANNLPRVNWLLSHPTWQLISKLSYCAYLWHVPLMNITTSIQRTPIYINGFLQFQMALSIFFLSLAVAVPWTLLFEMPMMKLGKIEWNLCEVNSKSGYSLLMSKDKDIEINAKEI